jgi:hypothetical protein
MIARQELEVMLELVLDAMAISCPAPTTVRPNRDVDVGPQAVASHRARTSVTPVTPCTFSATARM